MLGYRQRIFSLCQSLLGPRAPWPRALDFGSGDGWFAHEFKRTGLIPEVVPVDVRRREDARLDPIVYDGNRLPFADGAFELTYSIDVLHHCPDPGASLTELLRCTRRCLLIKDHVSNGPLDWLLLSVLDEIGNRRRGVPSPHHYQRGWEWSSIMAREGFALDRLIYPASCHPRPLDAMLRHVQYVALWRRARPPAR